MYVGCLWSVLMTWKSSDSIGKALKRTASIRFDELFVLRGLKMFGLTLGDDGFGSKYLCLTSKSAP